MTDRTTFGNPNQTVIQRLAAVKAELGTIEKEQISIPGQSFKAFTVDRVYGHLGPLFNKHGIVVVPSFVSADYADTTSKSGTVGKWVTVVVDYVFHGVDGSSVTMRFGAEGIDYQDKATNKAVQQAFKYGLVQMFQLSTGDVDPDADVLPEQVEPAKLSAGEKRMKQIKDAAWQHTTGTTEERIGEAKTIVEQSIAVYGREPKNQTDVQAIVVNIDEMFDTDNDDGSSYE